MSKDIKRIAVFSSGGDAPGMNAALRAVVRNASFHDMHVYGIFRGYEGMIEGDLERLERRDVGNIIHRGGTILKTARSKRFMTPEGRRSAYETLLAHDIEACIAIGGNGTFTGASVFTEEYNIPFMDKIRDTADSHNRLFFVEVMGRNAGFIALNTAIGSGAGSVLIPETDTSIEELVEALKMGARRKKLFSVVIVAEGNKNGNATEIADKVKAAFDFYDTKVTIIGHLQRGGSPTAQDRVLASRLGFHAVEGLVKGVKNAMVGIVNGKVTYTPFAEAIGNAKELDNDLVRMAEILAL